MQLPRLHVHVCTCIYNVYSVPLAQSLAPVCNHFILLCVCSVNLEKKANEYAYWADQFQQLPLCFMGFYGPMGVRNVIEVNRQVFVVCAVEPRIIIFTNLG